MYQFPNRHNLFFMTVFVLSAITAPTRGQNALKIFETDDRQYINDTTQFPYSAIGLVEVLADGQVRTGTGVLIGSRTILTNGHGVSTPGTPLNIQTAFFSAGRNGSTLPFNRIRVASVKVKEEWASRGDDENDFALLFLDQPVDTQAGFFKIAVQPNSFFDTVNLSSAGYPYDLGETSMYGVTGISQSMDGNLILNELDSEPGQSGSPLWYTDSNGEPRLVGLLKGIRQTTGFNGSLNEVGLGVRINSSVAEWIQQTMADAEDTAPQIETLPAPSSPIGCGTIPLILIFLSTYFLASGGKIGSSASDIPRR